MMSFMARRINSAILGEIRLIVERWDTVSSRISNFLEKSQNLGWSPNPLSSLEGNPRHSLREASSFMARRPSKNLTERELEIMQIIWEMKEARLGDIQAALNQAGEPVAASTVATQLTMRRGAVDDAARRPGRAGACKFHAGLGADAGA